MFKYKIKVSDARRAWMKSPEVLENCSTGFHFPSQSGETIQVLFKLRKIFPLNMIGINHVTNSTSLDHRER